MACRLRQPIRSSRPATLWRCGQLGGTSGPACPPSSIKAFRTRLTGPPATKSTPHTKTYLSTLLYLRGPTALKLGPGRTCLGKLDTLGCVDGDARHRPMENSPELDRQGWQGFVSQQ